MAAPTPQAAWATALQDVAVARAAAGLPLLALPEDMDGAYLFGLSLPVVAERLERLSGAVECAQYAFQYYLPPDLAGHACHPPPNTSGSARSEGLTMADLRALRAWMDAGSLARLRGPLRARAVAQAGDASGGASALSCDANGRQLRARMATGGSELCSAFFYRQFCERVSRTVRVGTSLIHGQGLFVTRKVAQGEMVIEYAGERIRLIMADPRERHYESRKIGCYMFRLDDDWVVDATMRGNAARFINHSCDPNCASRVVCVEGVKHIVIYALRELGDGEEMTYDYKFPIEDGAIPCHCGAKGCRGSLN